jgi:hypothetical protein
LQESAGEVDGMPDEFGTVNSRKDRAREITRLRDHYRNHRETLSGLMGDAPSDHLANEYQRLVGEIDTAVRKLDELEGGGPAATPPPAVPADTNPMLKPKTRPGPSAPGARPLIRPQEAPVGAPNPASRTALILMAGAIVIAAIAALIWYASSRRKPDGAVTTVTTPIVEQPVTTTTAAPATIAPASPPSSLKITPLLADYGTIRRGTRAVRQFEVVNNSGGPIDIQVARSACRCLFYDYKSKLAPNAKETITVTVDGGRAKAGDLHEDIQVSSKADPAVSSTITVQATIK